MAVLEARWGQALFNTPLGRSIKHFMDKLSGIRYEFHPNVPLDEHPQKVCDLKLDIGIAPLLDDQFNRHKSCIKYYEYAMSGAVTLASHVVPYSTEVPITAKNNRESWKRKLEEASAGGSDQVVSRAARLGVDAPQYRKERRALGAGVRR